MSSKKTAEALFPELAMIIEGDRSFTVHQLTNRGAMILLRMLSKLGAVIDWKEVYQIIGKEGNTDANVILLVRMISAIPIAEQHVYELLASVLHITTTEAADLLPSTTLDVLTALFKQEDIAGLLNRFFGLIGSLQVEQITGLS